VRGMDITIVTTAHDDAGGRALLEAYGFPFRRDSESVVDDTATRRSNRGRGGRNTRGRGPARRK